MLSKEFYAKMIVIHLKKKDIVKSKVRGIEIEFDHEKLATIAEFERKRANRFHDELEKAKAENAELLALLHQTQTRPHP
ncbi:hypothetical protein Dimus_020949 [Dionaea muscipula]